MFNGYPLAGVPDLSDFELHPIKVLPQKYDVLLISDLDVFQRLR